MDRNPGSSQNPGGMYHQQLKFSLADMGVPKSSLNSSTACHVSAAVTTPLAALPSHLRPSPSHPQLGSVHMPRPGPFLPAPPPIPAVRESSMAPSSAAMARASSSAVLSNRDLRMDLYHVNPVIPGGPLSSSHVAATQFIPTAHLMNPAALQAQAQNPFQKLKVEDALSYLDQVKIQFVTKPHVYNDFLEIMKDFKAQSVDTPGVIQRVSQLFRGHPNLIVGFNTFLPPGYKIEVHGERGERVSICTPSGQSHVIAGEDEPSTSGSIKSYLNAPVCGENKVVAAPVTPSGKGQVKSGTGIQPLEFNHAINYVNKIKIRFQNQPEVYKQFLEILHTYQKEQRELKEGRIPIGQSPLTEAEVYAMVARLFANEDDLLREFGQFLPDASAATTQIHVQQQQQQQQISVESAARQQAAKVAAVVPSEPPVALLEQPKPSSSAEGLASDLEQQPGPSSSSLAIPIAVAERAPSSHMEKHVEPENKRDTDSSSAPSTSGKRVSNSPDNDETSVENVPKKFVYDVSLEEAAKYATLSEYQFFDKVRKALRKEETYLNFLRCLSLFNSKLINKRELMQLVQHFLGRFPELLKWFRDFIECNDSTEYAETAPQKKCEEERISSDLAMEIDFASCKRYGVSYRALPPSYKKPHCSGRTLDNLDVLNDTWVSFPSWQSEDSSYVASKKTQYEEAMYRTEDERFELDIVVEVNRSTIQVFENVLKRMSHMSAEEAKHFQLDDNLGGTSHTIHQRAIRRVYGDCANEVIEGLKRSPYVVIPIVLKRLKAKDEEWREAQRSFEVIWREQNEKFYWKSLDHQGISFKQNDLKVIRSKALISQISTLYDERREAVEEGATGVATGPHVELTYPVERTVFCDVHDLLIHHVKRQTSIQTEEKRKIKRILKLVLPRLFGMKNRESENEDDLNQNELDDLSDGSDTGTSVSEVPTKRKRASDKADSSETKKAAETGIAVIKDPHPLYCGHCMIFLPNAWYIFLRLHHLFCQRLFTLLNRAAAIVAEYGDTSDGHDSASEQLSGMLKPRPPPSEYYPTLIRLIKSLLDGQIDSSQYEDSLREMFTIHAYVSFTFDKMIQIMVKQLQAMVTDPVCVEALELHNKWIWEERSKNYFLPSVRERLEDAYQREAERLMVGQNCFKIFFWYDSKKVTFEVLDTELNMAAVEAAKAKKWPAYIENYLSLITPTETEHISESFLSRLSAKPLFMFRNLKKFGLLAHHVDAPTRTETRRNGKSGGRGRGRGGEDRVESDENGIGTGNANETKSTKGNGSEASTAAGIALLNRMRKFNTEKMLKTALKDTFARETLQVLFSPTACRWQYISNTEDIFCRRGRPSASNHAVLTTKRFMKRTEKRNSAFARFHENWAVGNLTVEQARRVTDWFMGRLDDESTKWMQRVQVPCPIRPPYYFLNRYISENAENAISEAQACQMVLANVSRSVCC